MSLTLLLLFIVGLVSGFVGAFVGGASLISIPFLILTGLPANIALATNRFAATGMTASIVFRFFRSGKVQWKMLPFLTVLAVTGGIIGAHIVVTTNPDLIRIILAIITISMALVMMIKDRLIREGRQLVPRKHHRVIGYILYFLIMIFGGFCGGGSMLLLVATTTIFFGFTVLEANATNNIPWLILCLVALAIFIFNGLVNWQYGVVLLIGQTAGGYLGADRALAVGEGTVKKAYIALCLVSGMLLLFK